MATASKTSKPTVKKKAISKKKDSKPVQLTARHFTDQLLSHRSDAEFKKYQRYFKFSDDNPLKNDQFVGVRMGQVFKTAKEYIEMPPAEIEKLMESPIHELRAGAMSIMGQQARYKKTTPGRLKELYDLYLRRHDRVNSWDLVDLAAHHVIGQYLFDKPRTLLNKLAKSKNTWERRTAMLSTAYFIKNGETDDAYRIASILVHDKEEFVNTATGWMLRYAGDKNKKGLLDFLNKYAATMPRITLRFAIEHFNKKEREKFMSMKAA